MIFNTKLKDLKKILVLGLGFYLICLGFCVSAGYSFNKFGPSDLLLFLNLFSLFFIVILVIYLFKENAIFFKQILFILSLLLFFHNIYFDGGLIINIIKINGVLSFVTDLSDLYSLSFIIAPLVFAISIYFYSPETHKS